MRTTTVIERCVRRSCTGIAWRGNERNPARQLKEAESLAGSQLLNALARVVIEPSPRTMIPWAEALSLSFLEHNMGRVLRWLAFRYAKPQRMKVETIEQVFSFP